MTPRTLEAALLATRGADDQAIADHLGITLGTARRHIHNALTHWGATTRTQLAVTLIHNGEATFSPIPITDTLLWRLSARDIAVITDGARGIPTKTTAAHLGLTRPAISNIWMRLRARMDARNNTVVIVRAIRAGYLTTGDILNQPRSAAA